MIDPEQETRPTEFERAAAHGSDTSLVSELWAFLAENRKWWLIPILLVMLSLGLVLLLSNSAFAPFLYPLF